MTKTEPTTRWASVLTALRALLMLLGGLYALFFPEVALLVITTVAGALLLVDGILGLWATFFGRGRTDNFWFDVVRNALSAALGVLILLSPLLATLVTATFLVVVVAVQAIIVGALEIWVVVKERANYERIWPVLLSGALYIVFGLLLLFWPFWSALVMVMMGGALMVVFSFALFGWAWKLRKAGH